MSDSLGLHARLFCLPASLRICLNSCPLTWWVMLSNHLILCHQLLLLPSVFPSIFPMSWLFASGGQSIGASASTSVLPMNIHGWFPLGWTGWISLQSKGLSRVFFNTTIRKHQFFGIQTFFYDFIRNLRETSTPEMTSPRKSSLSPIRKDLSLGGNSLPVVESCMVPTRGQG